jgi:hypothetical protein
MIQIIAGRKGKGKTKHLIDKANSAVKSANGSIVYLDKSDKHMYELSNKIRLINVNEYLITNQDEFLGFISGIVSQDHDLEEMYLDSFLKIAHLEGNDIVSAINKLNSLGEKFGVTFVLSVSADEADLPEAVKPYIIVSL